MEEMIFVGYNYGRFENNDGQMQDYCNVFVLEPFGGTENSDYHFAGQKAMKYGCVSPEVWRDVEVGARVKVFFNGKKKISYMVAAD